MGLFLRHNILGYSFLFIGSNTFHVSQNPVIILHISRHVNFKKKFLMPQTRGKGIPIPVSFQPQSETVSKQFNAVCSLFLIVLSPRIDTTHNLPLHCKGGAFGLPEKSTQTSPAKRGHCSSHSKICPKSSLGL